MPAENLEYNKSRTCRSIHTLSGEIPPIGAQKIRFEETKRRGMSRTGKNEIILTCRCANRLHSTRLKRDKRKQKKTKRQHKGVLV